eukprot:sb/3469490/
MKMLDTVESEDAFAAKVCFVHPLAKVSIQIEIPEQLKLCLLDDWDLITQQKHLIRLPNKYTVTRILDEFRCYQTSQENDKHDVNRDHVLEGILGYFSRLLGMQLLYKFERPQYADVLEENKGTPVSEMYGAEHLLRLFTRIGELLAFTELDNNAMITETDISAQITIVSPHRTILEEQESEIGSHVFILTLSRNLNHMSLSDGVWSFGGLFISRNRPDQVNNQSELVI